MKKPDTYKTILVICLGFLVLYYFFQNSYFLYGAMGIGVLSLIFPRLGDWIVKGWYGLASVLGKVNATVLLSVVFFVFLLPLGLIYRLFSKDPLSLKNSSESLFTERNLRYTPKDLENPW